MRRRPLLAAVATSVLAIGLACAAPESASADTTTVTFTVTGGLLTIAGQPTAFVGSATPGSTISGSLGTSTVTDARGEPTDASWTATVSVTSFATGSGGTGATVPNSAVSYWSGPAVSTSGSGTFTPGQPSAANAVIMNVTQTAFTHTGGTGGNSAQWDGTLIVNVPVGIVTGTYTGTFTRSVA